MDGAQVGLELAEAFDTHYCALVSTETAGFFAGTSPPPYKRRACAPNDPRKSTSRRKRTPCFGLRCAHQPKVKAKAKACHHRPCGNRRRAAAAGLGDVCSELHASGCVQAAVSNACGAYVRAVLATNGVAPLFKVRTPSASSQGSSPSSPLPLGLSRAAQAGGGSEAEFFRVSRRTAH